MINLFILINFNDKMKQVPIESNSALNTIRRKELQITGKLHPPSMRRRIG